MFACKILPLLTSRNHENGQPQQPGTTTKFMDTNACNRTRSASGLGWHARVRHLDRIARCDRLIGLRAARTLYINTCSSG